MKHFTLRCDGACLDNPSPNTGVGMALYEDGDLVTKWGACTDADTNNEAEYDSIIEGLKKALAYHVEKITVLNDGQLIVNQINGDQKTKAANLKRRRERVLSLLGQFRRWEVRWVPREKNDVVDAIAKSESLQNRRYHQPWGGVI